MQINITLSGQIKRAAGFGSQQVEVSHEADDVAAIRELSRNGPEALQRILLTDTNDIQPTLLRFVNDAMIPAGQSMQLKDGDELAILTPVSGG